MKVWKLIVLVIALYICLPLLDNLLVKIIRPEIPSGWEYKTKEQCEQNLGDWAKAGLFPNEICRIPVKDYGKTCIAGFQCQIGTCVAQYRFRKQFLITGKCPKYASIFGCTQEVHFGLPKNAICRD